VSDSNVDILDVFSYEFPTALLLIFFVDGMQRTICGQNVRDVRRRWRKLQKVEATKFNVTLVRICVVKLRRSIWVELETDCLETDRFQ